MSTLITKETVSDFLIDTLKSEKDIELSPENTNDELTSLGLDSFGFLEIIFAIEHEYSINFPKQYDHIKTVQDVIDVTYDLASKPEGTSSVA